MSWLKRKESNDSQGSRTIDLRKKSSIFGNKKNKKKGDKVSDGTKNCVLCHKSITGELILCNQYLTRSKLCNAGPFCSDECWEEHMKRISHY
jgi:hypothetical protein